MTVPAPPRPVRLAAAGLALDRGPRALALRDLRADRPRLRRREAIELQAGADGGEVVVCYTVLIVVVFYDVVLRDLPPGWLWLL